MPGADAGMGEEVDLQCGRGFRVGHITNHVDEAEGDVAGNGPQQITQETGRSLQNPEKKYLGITRFLPNRLAESLHLAGDPFGGEFSLDLDFLRARHPTPSRPHTAHRGDWSP